MTTQTVSASSASLVLSKDLWREWKVDPTDASFVTVGLSAEQDEPELLQIASRAVDLMTTVSPAAVLARVDELEVELRSTVLQLVEGLVPPIEKGVSLHANSEEEEAIVVSRLLRYVQSAMGLCWHVVEFHPTSAAAMNMWRKVPFLLLEDMLDVVPLRWVQQRVWPQGAEPWIRGMLSRPTLLGASTNKLVLIRVCNQLLKQLSLSEELAGRVMMVLAAVFPLSERSGVNVLGTVRATPTILETPSEYSQHHSITQQAHPPKTNAPTSSSSSSLALDVCDEKVGGMEEVVAEIIQFQQQQQQQQQQVNGSDGMVHDKEEEEESKMGYDFYHVFWGLQNVFADYSSVLPSSSSSSKSSSGDPPNLWQHKLLEFISHAQQVLAAFEGHAFPSPERVSHSDRTTMTKTSSHAHTEDSSSLSTTRVVGHCHKYMTNSELLHLQLKDPELRIHILTQLLIVVPHLHQSCSVAGAAAAASGASTTTNNEYFMIRSKLLQLQQRAEELLNVVPPNGSQHLRTVQWLLKERESMWKRWKKTKCKPLEKTLLTTTTTTTTSNHETKKRRLVEERGSEAVVASVKRIRAALPSISKELRTRATPKLYDFLEEYVEALDPEAGIEDEYHPRNDKVFSWRALRLMRMQQTTSPSLIRRTDGDFEAMVRHIWQHERNITIPKAPTPDPPTPDPPTPPPEVVEESVPTTMDDVDDIYGDIEMKEAPTDGKDTAVTKKDKDEDDAASVGSAFSVGSAVSGTLLEEDTPSKNMMDHDGPKEKREETEMESLSSSTHHKPALEESKAAKLKEMEEMVAEEEEAEMMVVKQEPTSKEPVGDVISEKEPMTEKKEKGPKIEGKSKESKVEKKENESKAEGAEKEKEPPTRDPSPEMNGGDSGRRNNQKTHSPGGEKQDRRGSEGGRGGDSGHRGRGGSSSRDRDGDRRRGGGSYTSRGGGGGDREPRRGSDNRRGGGGGSNNRRRHNHRS